MFSPAGKMVSVSQEQYRFDSPAPGWAETDPHVILDTVIRCMNRAYDDLLSKGIAPSSLRMVGLTNQRESLVIWNRRGEPLCSTILWLDNRTEPYLDALRDAVARCGQDDLKQLERGRTGLRLSSYFTATKIHWVLENVPGLIDHVLAHDVCMGTVDSWLLYRLLNGETDLQSGGIHEHFTDVTNASRTLLFNIFDLHWDTDLINTLVLGRISGCNAHVGSSALDVLTCEDILACLSKVLPSQHNYGIIREQRVRFAAGENTLGIGGVCGDQQSALVGHLGFERHSTKVAFGTGAFVLSNIGDSGSARKSLETDNPLLTTVFCQFEHDFTCGGRESVTEGTKPVLYALEGSVSNAGTTVTQIVGLGVAESPQHLDQLAEKAYVRSEAAVDGYNYPRSGCVVVPAFNGLFGSRWDDTARCVISGITYSTGREQLCRAALEGIAYQTAEILEIIDAASGAHGPIMVDGGVTNSEVFLRIMANISETELIKSDMAEATAFGAAVIAGLTCGVYRDFDAVVCSVVEIKKRYSPDMGSFEREQGWKRWNDAVTRSHGLAEFE